MYFESVKAYAFGPFHNRTFDLAPGMNVIYGPNEAGKSSWHAALYAGLCGMRKGKGGKKADREFAERHQPWDGNGAWEAGAVIKLADGRCVELRHDLAENVGSAQDTDSGNDYTSQILFEKSPDGSRWLGLNRKSFLSTACIRQADILRVLSDANSLQEDMGHAAAAGADATPAKALQQLDDYKKKHVGSHRAPTKPLRKAKKAVEKANEALQEARKRRDEYMTHLEKVEQLEHKAQKAQLKVDAGKAALAEAEATEFEKQLACVHKLAARFPDGPPDPPPAHDALAVQVAIALASWEERPSLPKLTGPRLKEIDQMIAECEAKLGAARAVVAEQEVEEAEHRLGRIRLLVALFPDGSPCAPAADEVLTAEVTSVLKDWKALAADGRYRTWLLAPCVLAITAGAAIALALHAVAGSAIATAGTVGALAWWLAYEKDRRRRTEVLKKLRETAAKCSSNATEPEVQAQDLHKWLHQQKPNMHKLTEQWGELQKLLGFQTLDEITEETDGLHKKAHTLVDSADHALLKDFRGRSAGECLSVFVEKVTSKLGGWQEDRKHRVESERLHEEKKQRIEEARDKLRCAAKTAGVAADDGNGLTAALEKWQKDREKSISKAHQQVKDWDKLKQLLGNRSPDKMADEAKHLKSKADEYAKRVGEDALANARQQNPGEGMLTDLQDKAAAVNSEFLVEQGQLQAFAKTLPSVADAEEALADARREQTRVARLERTLESTIGFLKKAQEQVQHDIAPRLRSTVLKWLPRVTNGRYDDCRVDPESLLVEVRGNGGWHPAQLLSHGTAEQIYLLLRLALSQHLTKEDEVCPLILDDVVSAADAPRKQAVLETLLAISESTQVVLFTHENDVRDWARKHLAEPANRLTEIRLAAETG